MLVLINFIITKGPIISTVRGVFPRNQNFIFTLLRSSRDFEDYCHHFEIGQF